MLQDQSLFDQRVGARKKNPPRARDHLNPSLTDRGVLFSLKGGRLYLCERQYPSPMVYWTRELNYLTDSGAYTFSATENRRACTRSKNSNRTNEYEKACILHWAVECKQLRVGCVEVHCFRCPPRCSQKDHWIQQTVPACKFWLSSSFC